MMPRRLTGIVVLALLSGSPAISGCFDPARPSEISDPIRAGLIGLNCAVASPRIAIEIDFDGNAPSELAKEGLVSTLASLTHRPTSNISIDQSPIEAGMGPHSSQDLLELHRENFDHVGAEGVTIHVLYLNGPSENDDFQGKFFRTPEGVPVVVLLPFYWESLTANTPVVSVPGAGPRSPMADEYERSVLLHEIGHALGLVNLGADMVSDHEHPESPGHSSNPDSVMAPNDEPVTEPLAAPAWTFDDDDQADLRAFQDLKCPAGVP